MKIDDSIWLLIGELIIVYDYMMKNKNNARRMVLIGWKMNLQSLISWEWLKLEYLVLTVNFWFKLVVYVLEWLKCLENMLGNYFLAYWMSEYI